MIQEFNSPVGTGKTTLFIPFQMEVNFRLGCERFIVVGRTHNYKKLFRDYLRDKMGVGFYFSQVRKAEVLELDIRPYMVPYKNAKLVEDCFSLFAKSTLKTNIILDDCYMLEKAEKEIVDKIRDFYRFKLLTLVSQRGYYRRHALDEPESVFIDYDLSPFKRSSSDIRKEITIN